MSLAASAGRGLGAAWSPTHVQVTVLQARGLRAKGPGGTSDAYAVIQVGKEKYATSVSERSLGAPVWREEATFELPPLLSPGAVPAAAATLQLTVLHRALLGLDKFLGRAEVDLRELHRDQGRRRTQWYTLKSKPGKKDKERGEIEVDIQFMRNNMTASMFDLSVKDKSRNPLGKLKDKIKGRRKDSASDTASAIVPSTTPTVDSDDESSKDKKKKSKIKTLFSKSNLQKTPLSQSMSVLPTSKSDRVLLRPGDFQSPWEGDDDGDESSSASEVMSHKRTAGVDPKQLTQVNFTLPKKEGLSFLGGLRSKNDFLSRSNVCINGNHVYLEQPEAKSESKDSSPSCSPSPQGLRKKRLFSSTDNLAAGSWKEPGEGGGTSSDSWISESSTKDSLKSMSLPSYQPQVSGDIRGNTAPANLEAARETKESRRQENKKASLFALVTGRKDVAKDVAQGGDSESPPAASHAQVKPREGGPGPVEGLVSRSEKDTASVVSGRGNSLNPFEEDTQVTEPAADSESKSAPKPPVPSARAPQTKAVKPRSAQAPVPSERGHGSETQSSESPSAFYSFLSPMVAPISTSTPIENWPSMDKGQASSEEPSFLLKAQLPKESLTPVPNAVSSVSGSLFEQPPLPVCEGMEGSPVGAISETGTEESTSRKESGRSHLEQPETGQREELLRFSAPRRDDIPPSEAAPGVTCALSRNSGSIASPAGEPPTGGHTDFESQSRSCVEHTVRDEGVTSAHREAAPPLQAGEPTPAFDSMTRKHGEMSLHVTEGQKKPKKRVSFSEQLFTEEEVEEDKCHPQELACAGAAAGDVAAGDVAAASDVAAAGDVAAREPPGSAHAEGLERGLETAPGLLAGGAPASMAGCLGSSLENFSEGPTSAASSAEDRLFFRAEGDDTPGAQYQSKASDHEGLLSDPLSDLQSPSDVKSPAMAELNLTLPSIPEVASDDERGDQAEDGRKTAELAPAQVGASSLSTSPPCLEEGRGPAPAGDLRDFGTEAPTAAIDAPLAQATAPGGHMPQHGESSSLDKQLPGPGGGEEEKPKGSGRPGQPAGLSLDSAVASPPLSETFPATHSFPSSPRSDTHHTSTAESPKKVTAEGCAGKVDSFGKRKPLLQAWVSPSETRTGSAQPGAHRLHPVKPMSTTATKIANSSLGTATIISENLINEAMTKSPKKYSPSDPAFAYAQLTHDELIQLVLRQKETISRKEFQVRELEDYIDNLLVRVMEETPNILRIPAQAGKKAGKV